PLLFIFFLLAFLANTAREVAKGIADVAGDSSKGIMTIAVTQGPKRAAELAAAFFVVAVLLSFLGPVFDQRVSMLYYPIVVVAELGPLYSSYRLIREPTATTARKVKSQVVVWILLGLAGLLVGGAA